MNVDQAKEFLSKLGAKHSSKNGDWVQCSCVLAPWTHKTGKDNNPSFGLFAKPGEESYFNCFSCNQGSALDLLQAVEYYGKKSGFPADRAYDIAAARLILESEEIDLPMVAEYSEFPTSDGQEFVAWTENWIDSFTKLTNFDVAMAYMESRNVPLDQCDEFNLKYDPEKQLIVFPYRNVWGKLAGARGRSIDNSKEGWEKHYDYTSKGINNAKLVWFNEQVLQLEGPVVVVEGQFDALRVAQRYPKVVATMTAKPSHEKFMRLTTQDHVILVPDNDVTGEAMVAKYKAFLSKYNTKFSVLHLPDGVKDAGETHPDWLYEELQPMIVG